MEIFRINHNKSNFHNKIKDKMPIGLVPFNLSHNRNNNFRVLIMPLLNNFSSNNKKPKILILFLLIRLLINHFKINQMKLILRVLELNLFNNNNNKS